MVFIFSTLSIAQKKGSVNTKTARKRLQFSNHYDFRGPPRPPLRRRRKYFGPEYCICPRSVVKYKQIYYFYLLEHEIK